MKNVLDIFLQKQGLTRYDLSKSAGISEQTLSKASKRDPETYSSKTIIAIAKGTEHSPGEVLDALLQIRDSDELYQVTTLNELLQKVREKEDQFIVKGEFNELLKEIERSRISETAELGFQYGSGGLGTIAVYKILRILNSFGDETKLENLKQDIGTLYTIEFIDKNNVKLRLKQLDY
ncbi:helix-turn-helix domain-containing protein [Candidatus Enterococcus murrayae]|uniref:Helix-turn-helix transcriptional regulator n=1 Tax=Candidatus Enterococcus murrayae TaxID=2815321 RepID=A0ABS3HFN8_9ENTE|nr:helix-turn-helix domain-containing protein [Enterococcus sp. MJM16]MBO0452262.1 helix-turn-helix transcriptional regulator [Enterococcus sp. MJM16]